jgi:hypothetical protein
MLNDRLPAGQQFTANGTMLDNIELWMYREGSPTGTLYFSIANSTVDNKSSSILFPNIASIDVSTLINDSGGLWYHSYFESINNLTSGTKYWLIANASGVTWTTNYPVIKAWQPAI